MTMITNLLSGLLYRWGHSANHRMHLQMLLLLITYTHIFFSLQVIIAKVPKVAISTSPSDGAIDVIHPALSKYIQNVELHE